MSADRELLSITEVGEATGLPSSALRYYERSGLIAARSRVGGRRHYTPDVLHRLAVIALLQESGFTISEMAELFARRGRQTGWKKLAEEKLQQIDAHLDRVATAKELLTSALACECSELETCELISQRRGPHLRVVQTMSIEMGRRTIGS